MAAQAVLDMTTDLKEDDTVLFLLSDVGSALFEKPLIPGPELTSVASTIIGNVKELCRAAMSECERLGYQK